MLFKAACGVIVTLLMVLAWGQFKIQGLEKALIITVIKQEAAETSARTAVIEKTLTTVQIKNFITKTTVIKKQRDEARQEVTKMRDLFQNHDFAKLLSQNPVLIENLMIKKTEEIFDEIEAITAP